MCWIVSFSLLDIIALDTTQLIALLGSLVQEAHNLKTAWDNLLWLAYQHEMNVDMLLLGKAILI